MSAPLPRVARALFDRAFDYAGFFPPASLAIETAARKYDAYRRGPSAWMLGRMVLPARCLDEWLRAAASTGARTWPLSVVLGHDPVPDLEATDTFDAELRGAIPPPAVVDIVEAAPKSVEELDALCKRLPARMRLACEVPLGDGGSPLLRRLAEMQHLAKARCGGLVPDAIPSSQRIARFLADAAGLGIRVKLTAGLHHAVRGEYRLTDAPDAEHGTMHGFVNVLMAASACQQGERDVAALVQLLERRDTETLRVGDEEIRWGEVRIGTREAEELRAQVGLAIGTCSFEEPVSELKALGILGR